MDLPEKIMVITVTDSRNYPNHFWEKPLRESCKELIWINLQDLYFKNGKKETEKILLERLDIEKPDFLFMFDSLYYDLDLPVILTKLRAISPKTFSFFFSGDDDVEFDEVRYLGLFFDYLFIAHNNFAPLYKRDGLKNFFFIIQTKSTKITAIDKEYDVCFIGTPKADRKEILYYLHKKGIKLKVFGYNWEHDPDLKEIAGGVLPPEDYLKTIAQTKINLCFSKNVFGTPGMKGRFLEISECKAFSLVEEDPHLSDLFKEGKEIIFFKDKEDLFKKIVFYLDHDKEREKIANESYKKVKLKFDFEKNIKEIIKGIYNKKKSHIPLPKIDSSIINLNEKIMSKSQEEILNSIKETNFISFSKGSVIRNPFKDYLQGYSLIKNKKQISCCDYFITSNILGDYIRFKYCPLGLDPNRDYKPLLDINQIVISKEFFINNFDLIREAFFSDVINFVNDNNTAFVSIPLVSFSKYNKRFYNNLEFSKESSLFHFSFHRELYSRKNNPIKFSFYSLGLLKEIISGKTFILKQLRNKARILKS